MLSHSIYCTSMLDNISLFQNNRNWDQIRNEVIDLVDTYHALGIAQNGSPMLELESVLAGRFNRKHCVTTASCTDALVIALNALNLPKNSCVAVSNYTFTATAHAIARAGYQVIPVDVDNNYCINCELIPDVSAVVVVDLFGNMSQWITLEKFKVPIINDAAQSIESHNGVKWSAEYGLISCLSFSPSKTISSWGSGGALVTDNDDIANIARKLRLHGKIKNSDIAVDAGLNSMMSSFEIASVLVGLRYSSNWQQRRKSIADYLISNSTHVSGMDTQLEQHTYHKLVFQSWDRNSIIKKARDNQIELAIHYNITVNDETLYQTAGSYPASNDLKQISFTVPNQHTLTDVEVERIAKVLK